MNTNLPCLETKTNMEQLCPYWFKVRPILAKLAALVFILLFLFPATGLALNIPEPPSGLYVLDEAGVMSNETKNMVLNTSQELNRQTKAQVAVVTLKTLGGQSIEDVALGIGRKWGLGDKQLNNGIVILVVTTDKESRIEVGYGLEGALPDGKTGRIQDEYMLPYFQQGEYDLGLANGYKAVITEVAQEYGATINIGTTATPLTSPVQKKAPTWVTVLGVIGLIVLIWLDNRFLNGFFLGMILGMLMRGGRGGGGGFGGGNSGGGGSFGGGGSSRGW